MATPYLQLRLDRTTSTQDVARDHLEDLPVLVMSPFQTSGRGRTGKVWLSAPRALAVSLAMRVPASDTRPFSLMAGVAAVRHLPGVALKWPNDLMLGEDKTGGILVERSDDHVVVGLGLNLWWPDPPTGAAALQTTDPGETAHRGTGALWGAEMMRLIDREVWPRQEYVAQCVTLGRRIDWEPHGGGIALDVDADGGLVVRMDDGTTTTLRSGAVRHVR
ncbi:MAG: biotin--[acetyl-CoA-carboxylase] ligase [Actinobacteria bacterium]|nr:biotin--[acetyl-CoA-carboxylase] ligase [Actinomycetota bacterium]